jgi:hypothetical protein
MAREREGFRKSLKFIKYGGSGALNEVCPRQVWTKTNVFLGNSVEIPAIKRTENTSLLN